MMFIAGLILLLAGSSWFAAAGTVGLVLLIAGALLEVVPLTLVIVAGLLGVKEAKTPSALYRRR